MESRRGPRTRAHKESEHYRELLARVAHNLRRLRSKRGWTQEEAAERCGTATRVVQKIEAEDSNFTAVTIARFAKGFDVDPRELLKPIRRPGAARPTVTSRAR